MHEALRMAGWIREQLTTARISDNGAQYAITVSDTAGNVAEVYWDETQGGQGKWMWDEGVNLPRLKTRLRLSEEEG